MNVAGSPGTTSQAMQNRVVNAISDVWFGQAVQRQIQWNNRTASITRIGQYLLLELFTDGGRYESHHVEYRDAERRIFDALGIPTVAERAIEDLIE